MRKITEEDKQDLADFKVFSEKEHLRKIGATETVGEEGFTTLERTCAYTLSPGDADLLLALLNCSGTRSHGVVGNRLRQSDDPAKQRDNGAV